MRDTAVCGLRFKYFNFDRRQITIRNGEGEEDRDFSLPHHGMPAVCTLRAADARARLSAQASNDHSTAEVLGRSLRLCRR